MKKAKEYADIAWGKLGRILKIDETNVAYYPYYTSSASLESGQLAAANGIVIGSKPNDDFSLPVGKVNIIVNVVVTWILIYK